MIGFIIFTDLAKSPQKQSQIKNFLNFYLFKSYKEGKRERRITHRWWLWLWLKPGQSKVRTQTLHQDLQEGAKAQASRPTSCFPRCESRELDRKRAAGTGTSAPSPYWPCRWHLNPFTTMHTPQIKIIIQENELFRKKQKVLFTSHKTLCKNK